MNNCFDTQILIGGPAGCGIMASGRILAKTALRHGFFVFGYPEYPSLIRGGHNSFALRLSKSNIKYQISNINLLIALDEQTIELHKQELANNARVIFDPDEASNHPPLTDQKLVSVTAAKILTEIDAPKVVENSVFLGASMKILGLNIEVLLGVLAEEYEDKGEKIIKINQAAAKKGFESVGQLDSWTVGQLKENAETKTVKPSNPPATPERSDDGRGRQTDKLLLTGNEAAALAAIAAGCQAYFAYPMTPSTSILHFLAQHGTKFDMVVVQPEDETAVINMAIGTSFAGVRTMLATSGGGFCLMTEGLGLSGMTETPLVIVDSQRSGPTTGMPTWTEQGDLQFVLHAHQSDFPRIILAPGDAEEVFQLTFEAFNLADKYQLPVIVLLDKYLSESLMTCHLRGGGIAAEGGKGHLGGDKIQRGEILTWEELEKIKDFKRYQFTESGVSPRSLLGQEKGIFRANSDEHDEYGFSTEDKEMRVRMMDKRMEKLNAAAKEIPPPSLFGPGNAEVTFVGWGSTKGPALEAIGLLKGKANFLHLNYLWPFPKKEVKKILFMAKKVIILEGNYSGQLHSLIREQTGEKADEVFLKYDGRPFYPEEIASRIA